MNDNKVDEAVKDFDTQQHMLSRESEINMLNTTLVARTEALNMIANILSAGLLVRKEAGDKLITTEMAAMQQAVDVEQKKNEEMFARLKQLCTELANDATRKTP